MFVYINMSKEDNEENINIIRPHGSTRKTIFIALIIKLIILIFVFSLIQIAKYKFDYIPNNTTGERLINGFLLGTILVPIICLISYFSTKYHYGIKIIDNNSSSAATGNIILTTVFTISSTVLITIIGDIVIQLIS